MIGTLMLIADALDVAAGHTLSSNAEYVVGGCVGVGEPNLQIGNNTLLYTRIKLKNQGVFKD